MAVRCTPAYDSFGVCPPCRADSRTLSLRTIPLLLPSLHALIHLSLSVKRDRSVRAHAAVQRGNWRGTRGALKGHPVRHPQLTQFRPPPARRYVPFRSTLLQSCGSSHGRVAVCRISAWAPEPGRLRRHSHVSTTIMQRNGQHLLYSTTHSAQHANARDATTAPTFACARRMRCCVLCDVLCTFRHSCMRFADIAAIDAISRMPLILTHARAHTNVTRAHVHTHARTHDHTPSNDSCACTGYCACAMRW